MFTNFKNSCFLRYGLVILLFLLVFNSVFGTVFLRQEPNYILNPKFSNEVRNVGDFWAITQPERVYAEFQSFLSFQQDSGEKMSFSTFFGGSINEKAESVCVDAAGYIYITGHTSSNNFPTCNAYDSSYNGGYDAFLTKFSRDGALQWSTYLGGSGNDEAYSVYVDASGNIYVTGYTESSDFPVLNGYDNSYNGQTDVFLAEFSSDGTLQWSTFIGGDNFDMAVGVFVDLSGNIYITGATTSTNFPTLNAYDDSYNGGDLDAFLAKFSSDKVLQWSTYFGGNNEDSTFDVFVDGSGNIYITGETKSADFPTLNAYDDSYNDGYNDAFLAKFSSNGLLQWSTYLGGNGEDDSNGVFGDGSGNIYVTGKTSSNDFPTLNAYDNSFNGGVDAFLAKFHGNGSLKWSTYLGGSESDYANSIFIDNYENIYITGGTWSDDFPTLNAYNDTYYNDEEIFLTKFSNDEALLWSTYLVGIHDESSKSIFGDASGNICITGYTSSSDFPVLNAYDSSFNGGDFDVFLTKFSGTNKNNTSTTSSTISSETSNTSPPTPQETITVTTTVRSLTFSLTSFISTFLVLSTIGLLRVKHRNKKRK